MISDLSQVKLFVLDVDGVLTDGGLYMGAQGELAKRFDAKDGMGLSLLLRHGIKVAFLTGRGQGIVQRRAQELRIPYCFEGVKDKRRQLLQLAESLRLSADEIAYMGDDLNDLPAFAAAGHRFAPADGVAEVRQLADYVTQSRAGHGAVREVAEVLLKSRGLWDDIVREYLVEGQGDRQ